MAGLLFAAVIGAGFHSTLDAESVSSYVNNGEILIHGLSGKTSDHLPSADVLAALLYSHWHPSLPLLQSAFAAILAVLLIVIDGSLGVPTLLGLASAAAVFSCRWGCIQGSLTLFVLVVAGFLIRYVRAPTLLNALWLSVSIGCSFLFRSSMAFLPPLLACFALVFRLSALPRARAKHALVLLIVPYLFVWPVLRMNDKLSHRFIPFEDGEASGNIITAALGIAGTIEGPWRTLIPESNFHSSGGVLLWAGKEIGRHPLRYGAGYFLRLAQVFVWTSPFMFFALWALWIQRRRKEFQALGLLLAYWIGVHCLMSVQSNYFHPVMPLLILLACSLAGRFVPENRVVPRRFCSAALAGSLSILVVLNVYSVLLMRKAGGRTLTQAVALSPNDWWLLEKRGEEHLRQGALGEASADFSRSWASAPAEMQKSGVGIRIRSEFAAVEMFQHRFEAVWKLPIDEPADSDPIQGVRVRLLRARAWMSVNQPVQAAEEIKSGMSHWVSYCTVRGPSSGRGAEMLEQLRAVRSDEFVPLMESIIGDWPVADKTVLAGLAVSVYPRSVPAWISYAECLKQNGAQAQFQAALGRAAGLGAGPRQRRLLADAYIAASDFRRALEQLDGLPGPEDVDLLIEKARARAGLGQKESALSALSQAASLAPSPSQRRLLADAFSGAGDFRRALEQLDALPGPEDVDSLLEKARARAGLGQKGSALSALYKAASLGPSPSQRRRLADAFSGADDLKSALEQFEALPEPEDVDALVGKARALAGLGRKASAASVLSRAQTMVSDPEQKYKIALLYQDIAHHQQALAILAELTKARPRNMEFLVSRGVSEYMGGSPDRAMVDLKKAIQLSPNDLPAYVSLGFIYEEQGRYRQAVELYESALLNSRAQPADSIRQAVAEGLERTKAKVRSLKAWRAGTFVPRKTSN